MNSQDKFKFSVKDAGDQLTVSFSGVIDEDVDFSGLKLAGKKLYVFDFDAIKAINSCGIREWVRFTETIDPGAILVYQNCTQIIIEQINMVAGFFRAGSKVTKFYAPYFCETCDLEAKVLIDASQVSGSAAPTVSCETCKSEMEFDALEEQYFRFLKMTA